MIILSEKCSPKQLSQVSTPQITSNMSLPQLHLQLSEEEEGTDRVRNEVLARLGKKGLSLALISISFRFRSLFLFLEKNTLMF